MIDWYAYILVNAYGHSFYYSTMAGKPFKVGRFAHTLRVRLMREHIGVDVDTTDEDDLMANEPTAPEYRQKEWDPDVEQAHGKDEGVTRVAKSKQRTAAGNLFHDTLDGVEQGFPFFAHSSI